MTGEKALEIKGLKKYYGELKAVDGISFYVKQGQIFTLLGPNGAGKTTTVEILEGLKQADGGELYFFGEKCEQISRKQKEKIGVLLQRNNFMELVKVKEMIELFASFYQNSLPTEEILKKVALKDKAKAYVQDLSGGQKQRVAIGLALLNDPQIIFLDEPTTGLDPQARRNVWELIEKLRDEGKTIFLTTHYMEEAEKLSDYVYIMDQGKIIARGTPTGLIAKLGQENIIDFKADDLTKEELAELEAIFAEIIIEPEKISIQAKDLSTAMSKLLAWSDSNGYELDNLMIRRPNLEDVFLELTGKELRE